MAYPTSTTIVDRTYMLTCLVVMDPDVTLIATNLIRKNVKINIPLGTEKDPLMINHGANPFGRNFCKFMAVNCIQLVRCFVNIDVAKKFHKPFFE